MPDSNGTCTYLLDPTNPATWDGESGDECYVREDLLNSDGVWACPHDAAAGSEFCIFHRPVEEKDDKETRDAFLAVLASDDDAGAGSPPQQFIGARFDTLDLGDGALSEVNDPLIDFTHATFLDDVTVDDTTLSGISFAGAKVAGETRIRESIVEDTADFRGATFVGEANFDGTTFGGSAQFSDAEYAGTVNFQDTTFKEAVRFDGVLFVGEADFIFATFDGIADFTGVAFEDQATFSGATFVRTAEFEDAAFHGRALFGTTWDRPSKITDKRSTWNGVEFEYRAEFTGARFEDDADFYKTFLGWPSFTGTRFAGQADFREAIIGGEITLPRSLDRLGGAAVDPEANFANATFTKEALFRGSTFATSVNFAASKFEDDVVFKNNSFDGAANFRDATFTDGVKFATVSFNRDVEFETAAFRGALKLVDTTFEQPPTFVAASLGDIECTETTLSGADFSEGNLTDVDATDVEFREANFWRANCSGANFECATLSEADLQEATLTRMDLSNAAASEANFREAHLENADLETADLSGANLERAKLSNADLFGTDLSGARIYGVRMGDATVNTDTVFDAHGMDRCVYDPDSAYEYDAADGEQVDQLTKAMGAYHILEQLTRANTLPDRQATFFTRRQDMRRAQLRHDEAFPRLNYRFAQAQNAIFRHGESFARVVGWSAGTIVTFALLYPLGGWVRGPETGTITHRRIVDSPLLLWESFHHSALVFLSGKGPLQPTGIAGEVLTTVEALIAPILLALLVFVLGRQAAR